ncbi:MAG: VTT domain-containing protein [Hyphomicrobium sp.]|jgi:membrane protein DedA with SNARE-associated domain|nr:VTT domain-containing protein [Hyphomicrobium sp.]
MNLQELVEPIVEFVRTHEEWAVPMAFLVAFAESFCFLSILWPGTAILVGITALLAASGADQSILVPAIVAAGLGGTLGYAVSYWIGLYFKDSIPNIWPFKNKPELIRHGENFFEKWGGWGVFLGHFFGPVRAIIPVVAGMFRMRQLPFQIANAASAFIWAIGVIAPSFFAVTFREEIVAFVREHHIIAVGLLFATAYMNSIPMPLMAIPTLLMFLATATLFLFAGGDPLLAFLASFAGALAGDLLAYRSGKLHPGEDIHNVWPNSWSPESADQAIAFVNRHGAMGLIRSKFHTTLRSFAPLAAGAVNLPAGSFAAASVASCALWSALLLAPVPLFRLVFPA